MNQTQKGFFFELTPDRVLDAVEASGLPCTGRCLTLNSFENRVYDVELENSQGRRIAKFYRPGRWTREQILEEHTFLSQLVEAEIPVIAPLPFPDGGTLQETPQSKIFYTPFPKVGGRAPDELSDDQLIRIGRLLGRIHSVGAAQPAYHRLRLDPTSYGRLNLQFLLDGSWIPEEFKTRYIRAVDVICTLSEPWFRETAFQRIHGDCHFNNLLWNSSGPFFLDFDDMVIGPPVQDLWLVLPGRDAEAIRQRALLLEGYQEFRNFDWQSLRLVEPLRALRFVHYATWIARRWDDPAFPHAFPQFNTYSYWKKETEDLEEQVQLVSEARGPI